MRNNNETTNTRDIHNTRGRYVGPSAARIANLLPQRVRFEQGWFWTEATCHESPENRLAFRQRPDGDGIDVRCLPGHCSRRRIIGQLEALTGQSIWSAYTSSEADSLVPETRAAAPSSRRIGRWFVLLVCLAFILATSMVLDLNLQVVALNAFGLGWSAWLIHSFRDKRRNRQTGRLGKS